MDAVKTVRLPPALHGLMRGQVALASRLRKEEGLCGPCSTKISEAGWTGNRDVCADCQQAARPQRQKEASNATT